MKNACGQHIRVVDTRKNIRNHDHFAELDAHDSTKQEESRKKNAGNGAIRARQRG